MEKNITAGDSKFATIVLNAPLLIMEITVEGEILYINRAGALLFEEVTTHLQIPRDNLTPFLHIVASDIPGMIRAFRPPGGLIVNRQVLVSLPAPDGPREKYIKFHVFRHGENSYVVAIEDMTESYLQEQEMRRSAVEKAVAQGKYEIAADVIHDIGNAAVGLYSYLSRIRRSVELAPDDKLRNLADFFATQEQSMAAALGDAKAAALTTMMQSLSSSYQECSESIRKAVAEQLQIVTHIQDILNIQRQYVSGNDSTDKKPANLRDIINDCLSMQLGSIEKRGITVRTEITASSAIIRGDRTRLMQVILNVLKNAMEAIDLQAPVRNILIRLFPKDEDLILEIEDNGCGFDETIQKKLFSRGFTTKGSGSGLGLHNCRTILESHSATIELRSEGPGKGARATLRFKR